MSDKLRGGFLYAAHGLADIVVGGGVAQTHVAGSAESRSVDTCHVSLLKQIHHIVAAALYLTVAGFLPDIGFHLGEEVEGSLRMVDGPSGNLLGQADDQVATALESLAHILDAVLRAVVSRLGGFLRYGGSAGGVLSLKLAYGFGYRGRPGHVSDAPPCHGIGF